MKVCFFGNYDPTYPRNQILIKGLKQNKVEVIECNDTSSGFKKYWQLFKKHQKIKNNYDIMVVAYLGQSVMLLAKLICRKKIVFDTYLSVYDSTVFDRQICSPKSIKAKYLYFLDWFSCRLADICLLDTNQHIEYFIKTFNLKRELFRRIYIGADTDIYYPCQIQKKANKFIAEWHGYITPMHGLRYILEAAKILEKENIIFQIITGGRKQIQVKEMLEKLGQPENIEVIGEITFEQVAIYINQADICLGIFGQTPKAKRVIPCKVFEILACQKPLITAEAEAIEELLTDKINCLLVDNKDPKDLSKKILELKNDKQLSQSISQKGYQVYLDKCNPKVLGGELKEICQKLINNK